MSVRDAKRIDELEAQMQELMAAQENLPVRDGIGGAGGGGLGFGGDIQTVGLANAEGVSERSAREDHVHQNVDTGVVIDTVNDLPAIPESAWRIVHWTSEGVDGNGDDQHWFADESDTLWRPYGGKFTDKAGTPAAP